MASTLRRLAPTPVVETTIRETYAADRPRPSGRPWLAVCMVTSLDGAVAVDGTSGGLGNDNDLEVLLTMRDLADLIIVGAGTVRAEGYGAPRRPGQRIGVVTNSGRVDAGSPLFDSGAGFVITNASARISDSSIDVVRAGDDAVDLGEAMTRLDEVVDDAHFVTAEGGPGLNGSLLDAGLVDELTLTISPHLVGGDAARLTSGASPTLARYELAHLLADDDGYIFGRWTRP